MDTINDDRAPAHFSLGLSDELRERGTNAHSLQNYPKAIEQAAPQGFERVLNFEQLFRHMRADRNIRIVFDRVR